MRRPRPPLSLLPPLLLCLACGLPFSTAAADVAPWVARLGDDDPYRRGDASVALGQMGEAAVPVSADRVFEAASMSKPVLAMLAMQLVDAGQLDLDRPVTAYGPELAVPDVPDKQRITARMLLSHTAGYPNWRPGGEEVEGPLPLLFRPGARFGYSGEGIFRLQRHVEWLTGQPLLALAQARLFGPLGLNGTDFGWRC